MNFTAPQPKASQVEDINDNKYDSKEEQESRIANYKKEYARAKQHADELKLFKESGRLVDVGCSYGIFVKAAQDEGFDASGIEPAKNAAAYAKQKFHVNVFQGTLDEAKVKENTYDIVTLYDVLEHIPNLKPFLKEIRRVLKPGGFLVVQSPNVESYAFQILKTNWNWLLVPNHLWHFSKKSLSNVLEENGFTIKKVITEDAVYDFASNFKSTLHFPIISSGITFKILRKIIYIFSYGFIFIGTRVWSKQAKGGILRVYAQKTD